MSPARADDASGFDGMPDASWTRFDPYQRVVWDVSGGKLVLSSPAPSEAEMIQMWAVTTSIYARGSLIAPTTFARTVVMADISAWSPDRMFPAVLSRVNGSLAAGGVSGYGLSMIDLGNGSARLQIHRLDNEIPALISGQSDFLIEPAESYRLVLSSNGANHVGRVFKVSSPLAPLATVDAVDGTYESGRTALSLSTDRPVSIQAAFDNFLAWDGTPPPIRTRYRPALATEPVPEPAVLELLYDLRRGHVCSLQSTVNPADDYEFPWEPWWPLSSHLEGGERVLVLELDGPRRFFRLSGP